MSNIRLPIRASIKGLITGEFDPISLFASGEQGAWYDPSDLTTLYQDSGATTPVTTDGDPVGYMADKSGNGNHAIQSVAANRPLYRTDGTLHWLEGDGVDDFLRASYPATLSAITRAVSYRVLGADFICDVATVVNSASLYSIADGNLRWGVNGAGAGNNIVGSGGWTRGIDSVAVASASSAGDLRLTGTGSSATGTASTPPSDLDGITIMASATGNFPLQGRLYGFVDVDRVVSDNERQSITAYLANKAGVTL